MVRRIALIATALVLAVGNAVSSPLSIELTGRYYYGLTSDQNFRLLATFQSDLPQLDSLSVEFFPPFVGTRTFGPTKSWSAFSLVADTSQSNVVFSPSSASGGPGYLRFSGDFASGMNYFPESNGLQALTYDIQFSFAQIDVAALTTQPRAMPVPYNTAFAYITTQVGAYADSINDPMLKVNSIPEPETYTMLLIGIGLLGIANLRRLNIKTMLPK